MWTISKVCWLGSWPLLFQSQSQYPSAPPSISGLTFSVKIPYSCYGGEHQQYNSNQQVYFLNIWTFFFFFNFPHLPFVLPYSCLPFVFQCFLFCTSNCSLSDLNKFCWIHNVLFPCWVGFRVSDMGFSWVPLDLSWIDELFDPYDWTSTFVRQRKIKGLVLMPIYAQLMRQYYKDADFQRFKNEIIFVVYDLWIKFVSLPFF